MEVQRNFKFLADLVFKNPESYVFPFFLFHFMLCFVSLNLDIVSVIDISNFSFAVFLKFLPFSCRSCCMFYIYLFVCLSTYLSILSCIYSFVLSSFCSFVRFLRFFIYQFICVFMDWRNYWFIHCLFIYLFIIYYIYLFYTRHSSGESNYATKTTNLYFATSHECRVFGL